MKIRFMSGDRYKVEEVRKIFAPVGVDIIPVSRKLEELQTEDVDRLVEDKLTKAFEFIGRPLFVEHTVLYLESLNGLPGGLTQIFWDRLEADRFAALVHGLGNPRVVARTVLGYCDGRQIHLFEGAISGHVPKTPAGPRHFKWDCVFIPDGCTQTFAEMGDLKNDISMRRKALDAFGAHLASVRRPHEC